MSTSTAISIASLIVALLALPTSYLIAVRQVRTGLDERERRGQLRARFRVADALDEFFKVFYAGVEELTGVEPNELRRSPERVEGDMTGIEAFIGKTGVLDRLAAAIDNFAASGYAGWSQTSSVVAQLQSIRSQIALGDGATRYASLGVISVCGGADLQAALRAM